MKKALSPILTLLLCCLLSGCWVLTYPETDQVVGRVGNPIEFFAIVSNAPYSEGYQSRINNYKWVVDGDVKSALLNPSVFVYLPSNGDAGLHEIKCEVTITGYDEQNEEYDLLWEGEHKWHVTVEN